MNFDQYQKLASRTINKDLDRDDKERHALFGMAGEVGEIHSLYQKEYQGHTFTIGDLISEIGDLMWFIAELCTVNDITMDEVAAYNIDKLMRRYPQGFSKEDSIARVDVNDR